MVELVGNFDAQSVAINLWETLMFIYMQKINLISNFFFEILERHCKLGILKTSRMLDHPHQNHSISLYQVFMLIYTQKKINFSTHFFLKILPGHTHLKRQYQFEETFHVYLQAKNLIHSSRFPWDIAKMLQTCFRDFGNAWLNTIKVILSSCRKLSCLSACKKSTSSTILFWTYYKNMQTSSFGYIGHAWLQTRSKW